MGLVPWHTFSRSYFPILHLSKTNHCNNYSSFHAKTLVSMKKAIEEAGFLESYTLHVPHPPLDLSRRSSCLRLHQILIQSRN
ncbi:unnamed protein product [Musa textilis]